MPKLVTYQERSLTSLCVFGWLGGMNARQKEAVSMQMATHQKVAEEMTAGCYQMGGRSQKQEVRPYK